MNQQFESRNKAVVGSDWKSDLAKFRKRIIDSKINSDVRKSDKGGTQESK